MRNIQNLREIPCSNIYVNDSRAVFCILITSICAMKANFLTTVVLDRNYPGFNAYLRVPVLRINLRVGCFLFLRKYGDLTSHLRLFPFWFDNIRVGTVSIPQFKQFTITV